MVHKWFCNNFGSGQSLAALPAATGVQTAKLRSQDMARSCLEPRLQPLGDPFISDFHVLAGGRDAGIPSADASLASNMSLSSFMSLASEEAAPRNDARRMQRPRSFAGYVPHALSSKKLEALQDKVECRNSTTDVGVEKLPSLMMKSSSKIQEEVDSPATSREQNPPSPNDQSIGTKQQQTHERDSEKQEQQVKEDQANHAHRTTTSLVAVGLSGQRDRIEASECCPAVGHALGSPDLHSPRRLLRNRASINTQSSGPTEEDFLYAKQFHEMKKFSSSVREQTVNNKDCLPALLRRQAYGRDSMQGGGHEPPLPPSLSSTPPQQQALEAHAAAEAARASFLARRKQIAERRESTLVPFQV